MRVRITLKMSAEWFLCLLGKLGDSGATVPPHDQIDLLQTLVQLSVQLDNRKALSISDVRIISKLLSDYSDEYKNLLISTTPTLINEATPTSDATLLHNTLKLLRNVCAGVPSNQANILSTNVLPTVVSLLTILTTHILSHRHTPTHSPTPHDAIVTTTLQLLSNLCVGCPEAQAQIWKTFFPHIFKLLPSVQDVLISETYCLLLNRSILDVLGQQEMISVVLHNCTCMDNVGAQRMNDLIVSEDGLDILTHIVSAEGSNMEWKSIFMTSFLRVTSPLRLHDNLQPSHHSLWISLLTVAQDVMEERGGEESEGVWCEESDCVYLVNLWTKGVETMLSDKAAILTACCHDNETHSLLPDTRQNIETVCGVLRVLCCLSVRERCLVRLQRMERLMDSAIALLKQLSLLDGSASSVEHRSNLREAEKTIELEKEKLLFGFKRDLLQLISSLLYRCPKMQEKIRELEAIVLLLNQCHIDHNNPYIMQWAILAIRNMCEDNPTNQQLIAQLETQGVSKETTQLPFGCEVEVGSNGKLKMKQNTT